MLKLGKKNESVFLLSRYRHKTSPKLIKHTETGPIKIRLY